MTACTVFAVLGWVAFVSIAFLYRRGNQINSAENLALEAHCLAVILADDFLDFNRRGIEQAFNENPEWINRPPQEVVYLSMQGILNAAKKGYNREEGAVDTISLCLKHIEALVRPRGVE